MTNTYYIFVIENFRATENLTFAYCTLALPTMKSPDLSVKQQPQCKSPCTPSDRLCKDLYTYLTPSCMCCII